MAEVRTWKCDGSGCGAIRKESNNWWMLGVNSIRHLGQDAGFMLQPFEAKAASQVDFHFCGLACALRKISELAGTVSLTPDT
jgi:hypothetical protein